MAKNWLPLTCIVQNGSYWGQDRMKNAASLGYQMQLHNDWPLQQTTAMKRNVQLPLSPPMMDEIQAVPLWHGACPQRADSAAPSKPVLACGSDMHMPGAASGLWGETRARAHIHTHSGRHELKFSRCLSAGSRKGNLPLTTSTQNT